MEQKFEFRIAPAIKQRPRFRRFGGHVSTYTPAKTRNAEAELRLFLTSSGAKLYDAKVPLFLTLTFGMLRPASAPKRVVAPATRPDIDQYIKLVLDAGNGVLWNDDAQIVSLSARKVFAVAPFVRISVVDMEGEHGQVAVAEAGRDSADDERRLGEGRAASG